LAVWRQIAIPLVAAGIFAALRDGERAHVLAVFVGGVPVVQEIGAQPR
jgi:hypothetical protein